MEFTPHQVSCADQLMANARNRLGIVLPRMRTIVEDNGDNPWPELAALAKGTLVAVSNIPDARARTEAVANLATLHTLTLYELAKATEPQPEPEPKLPNPAADMSAIIAHIATNEANALELQIKAGMTAAVLNACVQAIAASDSGNVRLDKLAELAVETMAEYIRVHHRQVQL